MSKTARYNPSPYHKSAPSGSPRRDKTVCDGPASTGRDGRGLPTSGFRRGMVSSRNGGVGRKTCGRSTRTAWRTKHGSAIDEGGEDRIVLRSRWPAGRRFELARLLADRLPIGEVEPLRPATRAHTYRQKMQRAFAGEFLCPVDSLAEYLDGDYSNDAREDAAGEFRVSPLAVTTILVDNDMIDRDEMLDRRVLAA